MKTKTKSKKLLAVLLAMVLCMTLRPTTAFAGIGIGGGNNRTVYIGQDIGSISVQTANGHLIMVDSVSLPNGLLFDNQGPQAFIKGTPVAGTTGIYTSTFTDSDDNASNTLTLTVAQGLQTIVQPDITKAVGDAGFQLTPHSTNGNGTTITGTDTPNYTFGGGNPAIATIDASGNVAIVGTGSTTFTIDSAANASYQAATQKVVNITVNAAASITPTSATFDRYASNANYQDISTTLTNNSNTLTTITSGGSALTAGTDYTVAGNTYTFKKEYLDTLGTGAKVFTFDMDAGTDPTFTITISDSTPAPVKTVSVGAQNGTLTAGTAGSVTFTVTTANIANGTYPVTLNNAPTGATAVNVTINNNSGTLTVNTTAATPQGTHTLTLTIDGATSNNFNLVVGAAAPVCTHPNRTWQDCRNCADCGATGLNRTCTNDAPCTAHFNVPVTGIADMTGYTEAMVAFIAVSAVLLGCALPLVKHRRSARRS